MYVFLIIVKVFRVKDYQLKNVDYNLFNSFEILIVFYICIILFDTDNNHNVCGLWKQHKFLLSLHKKIKSDEGWASVKEEINNVKSILTNPNNLKMHISADLNVLCEIQPNASFILETSLLPPNIECCLGKT